MRQCQIGSTSIPLELRLFDSPGGPVTGQTPTVAIRRKSDNFYLDFNDNTFKNSAWGTRTQNLTELSGNELDGVYRYVFNSAASITAHGEYSADFSWNDGSEVYNESEDLKFGKYDLATKALVNRMTLGKLTGILTVYEDDGTTVAETWNVTDKDGDTPVLTGTAPANRSAAT